MMNLEKIDLTEQKVRLLEDQIKSSFLSRKLYKGAAEVINAIVERRPITTIYLVGALDPWYENSIIKTILQTENQLGVVRLDKKYQRMVYDVIKDLHLNNKLGYKSKVDRKKSRRFFLTRAFAI